MTRILSFADGFTSSTAPLISGTATQEDFVITNNVTGTTLLTIASASYKTAFFDYNLMRTDVGGVYIQQGAGIMSYDGTDWTVTFGNYIGSDLIVDTSPTTNQVKFYMTTSTGVGSLKYDSGAMGGSYSGEVSFAITRITA